jgi:hypothetical protein
MVVPIRSEQIEVLRNEVFVSMVRAELAEQVPAAFEGIDAAKFATRVDAAILAALAIELSDGWDIYRYVEYYFRFGADFATRPEHVAAAAILADPTLDGGAKMDWLDSYYSDVVPERV